jgi:hypothetical protein
MRRVVRDVVAGCSGLTTTTFNLGTRTGEDARAYIR